MTVDEALDEVEAIFLRSESDTTSIETIRRYAEEVREVERLAKIDQIPAAVDYGKRLAAAREGLNDD